MKPDGIDAKILEALMADGRASFRKIAERTSLTTPTVSARVARMTRAGLIKRFVPILSPESVGRGVWALITLEVDPSSAEKVAGRLAKLQEVDLVYVTTGQGVTLKISLESAHELQTFLKRNVLRDIGVAVTSSQIITSIVKEEHSSASPRVLTMELKCDYCHGDVTSNRPSTISVGSSHYYFCCRTCRKAYLDKNGPRLAKLGGNQLRSLQT